MNHYMMSQLNRLPMCSVCNDLRFVYLTFVGFQLICRWGITMIANESTFAICFVCCMLYAMVRKH